MKILSLGLDPSVLDKTSALAGRVIEYGELVKRYLVIVPSRRKEKVILSAQAKAYGAGGGDNKLSQLIHVYKLSGRHIRWENLNLITVQDQYYLAWIGLILANKFKIGLEIQVHGFEKFKGLRKLVAKYVLPRASVVRCVSQRLKEQLIGQFGVAEEKITVVPIYSNFRPTNYKLKIDNKTGKFIFLTVGRLVPVKNINLEIRAMREVIKQYPGAELWIVGDGEEKEALKSSVRRRGLKNTVKMLGWQDNPGKYYSQADAFVLTSNSEGWGLAVVEAVGYGLPVIMTDVGLAGEVIRNNQSGFVVPVGDKEKLVEAMIKMAGNYELRKKFSQAALKAAEKLPDKLETLVLYKKSWRLALAGKTAE